MTEYEIIHQPEQQLFAIDLEDGERALLRYKRSGAESAPASVDFFSTFVPDSHRGHGLAARLVETGFSWAEDNDLVIETSCWYARKKFDERVKR